MHSGAVTPSDNEHGASAHRRLDLAARSWANTEMALWASSPAECG